MRDIMYVGVGRFVTEDKAGKTETTSTMMNVNPAT